MKFNKKVLVILLLIILSMLIIVFVGVYYCFKSLTLKDITVECKNHIEIGTSEVISIYTYYTNDGVLPDKIVNRFISLRNKLLNISIESEFNNLEIDSSNVYIKNNEIMYVCEARNNGKEKIIVKAYNIQKELDVVCGVLQPEKIEAVDQLLVKCDGKTSKKITYSFYPNYSDDSVTFSSSNEKIARVDSEGNVFGVSGGNAVIYTKTTNGLVAETKVTSAKFVTSFKLREQSISRRRGSTFAIGYDILPTDASYYSDIAWKVENESILKQTSNGVFKAIYPGTTRVIATITSEEVFTAICTVTVF